MSAPLTPSLRRGLKSRARDGMIGVTSPATGREHLLREEEWEVALQMDGRRTLPQLQRRARRLGVPAGLPELASFVRELRARGLLEGAPDSPPFALRGWPEEKQRRVQAALAALKAGRYGEARALLEEELRRSPGCQELQALLEGVRRAEVDASSEQDEQWALAEMVRAAGEGLALPAPLPLPARSAPALPGPSPWRRWIAAGAAVLLAAFAVPLPDSASGECVLVPADREVVRAAAPGRLERVLVEDGAQVRRGDLLARLADPELASRLESASARRRQAELELQALASGPTSEQRDQARAAAARARAEVGARERGVASLTAAAASGDASRMALAAEERALADARWAAQIAEAALRLVEAGAAGEAIARRRAELEEATAAEAGLARQREAGAVRAPRDGRLRAAADLPLRVGAWIQPGEPLGEVAGGRSFRAEGRLSELDAADLGPGRPFEVRLSAPGAPVLEGRVESVGERFEPNAGSRGAAVRVSGTVDDPSGTAREGMRGRLEVERGWATAAQKVRRAVRHFLAGHGLE